MEQNDSFACVLAYLTLWVSCLLEAGLTDAIGRIEGYDDHARITVSFQTGSTREAYGIPAGYLAKVRRLHTANMLVLVYLIIYLFWWKISLNYVHC